MANSKPTKKKAPSSPDETEQQALTKKRATEKPAAEKSQPKQNTAKQTAKTKAEAAPKKRRPRKKRVSHAKGKPAKTAKTKVPSKEKLKKTKGKVKEPHREKVVVFDKTTIRFYLIAVAAVVVLLTLAASILSPSAFRKVFRNTPVDRNGLVMRVGDYKVMADEFKMQVLPGKYKYETIYGASYWSAHPTDDVAYVEEMSRQLIQKYAYFAWAKELGIALTDADRRQIDANIEAYIYSEYGGSYDSFLRMLDANYCTADLFTRLAYNNELIQRVRNAFLASPAAKVTDEDVKTHAIEKGVLCIKEIYFAVDEDMSETDVAAQQALAESVLARIQNGEDFDTLMRQYTNTAVESGESGYAFEPGSYITEVEEATKALEVGGISDVIASSMGFHIVIRLEPDYKNFSLYNDYVEEVKEARIAAKLVALSEQINIEFGAGYQYIKVADIKWNHKYPQTGTSTPLPEITEETHDHDHAEDAQTTETDSEAGTVDE